MAEVRAKKALGQHFLTDLNIARKIATSLSGGTAENPDKVLEVGCGMGVLTQFLLQRDDVVTYGAEIDSESVEYLHSHFPEFAPRSSDGIAYLRLLLIFLGKLHTENCMWKFRILIRNLSDVVKESGSLCNLRVKSEL